MIKNLGKSITIANAAAFIIVVIIGGFSMLLTKDILHNAYKIQSLSQDIITINSIHADAYRLVLSIHHFLIDPDELYSEESINTITSLKSKLEEYRENEAKDIYDGENEEIKYLDIMLQDIRGLDSVREHFENFRRSKKYDRDKLISLEEFAYELEDTADQINKIHMARIKGLIDESLADMWLILFIYLIFVTIGGLAIYAGHIILLKKIVNPIKDLAAATMEFANGTFNKRVHTDSKTEIGQLYESFNKMAEKLQENDEITRQFNEELETKVKERTFELQQANEKLQNTQIALIRTERIAAVGQIAAGVTHEIKNPLNSLSINTQLLLKEVSNKLGDDSSICETASLIRFEINRINNILEEFVKYAKFPQPQFYDNDINRVITEVVNLICSNAKDRGVKIETNLEEGIPVFKFDARQFKEVLINLSQNAIKAMAGGGRLGINTSTKNGNVIISISDTGEGIPEKNIDKIFTPFYSTKEGGLGLGLSIVQKIVESHGGSISCRSNVGEGTTFQIFMPMHKV